MFNIRVTVAFLVGVLLAGGGARADLITNGDFETGDFTGWSNDAGATIVTGGSALAGDYSAFLPGGGGGGTLSQSITTTTDAITTTFIFSMPDPGGAGDRGLNALWKESDGSGNGQINLRVVDIDDDGDGDVQVYSSSWQTLPSLKDSVSFGTTNTLTLTINGYGGSFSYDVAVNSSSATGLTYRQNQDLDDLARFYFSNQYGEDEFTVDNVVIPEPATLALAAAGLLGLRRRRACR